MKASNLILAMLGLFLLAFIAAMTVIFCVKGAVPDILIQYTLGAGGVEALLLAGIKVSKILGSPREPSEAGRVGRGQPLRRGLWQPGQRRRDAPADQEQSAGHGVHQTVCREKGGHHDRKRGSGRAQRRADL